MRCRLLRRVHRAWILVPALVALLGGVAFERRAWWARYADPPRDVLLERWEAPSDSQIEPWLSRQRARLLGRRAYLAAAPELIAVGFDELGLSLDREQTGAALRTSPPGRGTWPRLKRALLGPPLSARSVEPVFAFDRERARARLQALSDELRQEPIDAALDLRRHRRIEDREGRELLVEESLEQIEAGARAENTVFRLVFAPLPPKVQSEQLVSVDVRQIAGQYQTSFTGRAGARAVNIRRAAALLDRLVIAPHAVFSFNRSVGPREKGRGFVEAPVIVNDETEPGLGGGVCQVATTLHAAAVLAGLEVLERRSHSRPSGYAPLGLDATVIDGKVDLRLRNPYEFSVMIHSAFPNRTSLRVEILGGTGASHVDYGYEVIERRDFYRRIVEHAELTPGTFERKQKGGYGYDVISTVRLTWDDGSAVTRHYPSKYYPVPEVLWVAPGLSPSELPPLPDGASTSPPAAWPEG